MQTKPLPDTIRAILDQAGGLGLTGAFVYIGAQDFTYRCAEMVGEYPSGRSWRWVNVRLAFSKA